MSRTRSPAALVAAGIAPTEATTAYGAVLAHAGCTVSLSTLGGDGQTTLTVTAQKGS